MKRFVEGEDRTQNTLLAECLDDYVAADNPVRVIDVLVDELDLHELGSVRAEPATTGRPSYHPGVLLKIDLYGYLNRIQSSRSLETRGAAKRRADVADWSPIPGLQDDRRLPSGQWRGYP
jgi:transposase